MKNFSMGLLVGCISLNAFAFEPMITAGIVLPVAPEKLDSKIIHSVDIPKRETHEVKKRKHVKSKHRIKEHKN